MVKKSRKARTLRDFFQLPLRQLLLALTALFVNGFLEGRAWDKLRKLLGGNLDCGARNRVATCASGASLLLEGAESDEGKRIILLNGCDDFLCDCGEDAASLSFRDAVFSGDFFYKSETIHEILLGSVNNCSL